MSHIRIKYPTQVVKQKCLSEGPERHFFLILLLKVIRLGLGLRHSRTSAGHLTNFKKTILLYAGLFFYPYVPYVSKLPTSLPGIKKAQLSLCFLKFVIRLGFEPKTHSLEGCCSIQLSYRTLYHSDGLGR